jgi:hypothetical protein
LLVVLKRIPEIYIATLKRGGLAFSSVCRTKQGKATRALWGTGLVPQNVQRHSQGDAQTEVLTTEFNCILLRNVCWRNHDMQIFSRHIFRFGIKGNLFCFQFIPSQKENLKFQH